MIYEIWCGKIDEKVLAENDGVNGDYYGVLSPRFEVRGGNWMDVIFDGKEYFGEGITLDWGSFVWRGDRDKMRDFIEVCGATDEQMKKFAALGSLAVLLGGENMAIVPGGLLVKSIGVLPMYVMSALLAEALDRVEWKNGFRADGFSVSVNSITQTTVMGLGQTVLLAGINLFGDIAPTSTAQIIAQPEAIRSFSSWCFAGIPMLGYVTCAIIMAFYDVEKSIPQASGDLAARGRERH